MRKYWRLIRYALRQWPMLLLILNSHGCEFVCDCTSALADEITLGPRARPLPCSGSLTFYLRRALAESDP
jgi:hypothetical protein